MTVTTRAPSNRLLTTELFREVHQTGTSADLVAVGIALHHFTEPVRDLVAIEPLELHRATTILTKQIATALDAAQPLLEMQTIVTDPDRIATRDRRTAAELCDGAWSRVRLLADDRALAALEGAETFGEAAVLHLAATRAVRPRCVWWGTDGWRKRIDEWAGRYDSSGRARTLLLTAPEYVDDDVLAQVVDVDTLVGDEPLAHASRS